MADFDAELVRLTAAEFAHLGRAATYTPAGGPAVACSVTLQGADVALALANASMNAPDYTIRVAASAIAAAPKPGDTFTIGAETFHVLDTARRREDDREVWTVDVEVRAA